jgi:DNA-binding transcriptional ArsR family regulator
MSLPAVSKHLKVLRRAGLIEQGRRAQWRPCRIRPAPLKGAAAWVEQYRALWEERYEQLDAYLEVLKQQATSEHVREAGAEANGTQVEPGGAR